MMVKDKHKRMTVDFLEGLLIGQELKEGRGNNRSVMPLDALGRTRATMLYSECGLLLCLCIMHRDRGSSDIERWRKTWERIARWG